jgi:hypothetical protein
VPCFSSSRTKHYSGGSFDADEKKTPTDLILDESHQYYISDFVLPFYSGTRKHGVGIKMFSQSCNNFPPNDIDIFLATASHLVAFGIGSKDAERIVKDLAMPLDGDMVKSGLFAIFEGST